MADSAARFIATIITIFAGALEIRTAILSFKRGQYFLFGVDIMFSILAIIVLILIFVRG